MSEFTNEPIEIDLLPKFEEVSLNAPDPRFWRVIAINISILMILSAIGIGLFIFFNEPVRAYSLPIITGFMLLFLLLFLLYKVSFKKRGYALREKDMIYKSGIIAETTTVVPLNRIQHVALDEGLFSRMYNLATLQIYTAGGSTGHMHIAGIPLHQARAIKEALLKKLDLLEKLADQ
ncbi:PH domain-containing protein [Pedobacter sp. Du54]|uniref:PH domain-containing protein n=1 Tax=Pedobacter anseongensis TaxID=3133439 RepID=UPI0030A0B030